MPGRILRRKPDSPALTATRGMPPARVARNHLLLAAAILGLATVLPAWLSALIVGVVLLIVAGIAALIGKKKIDASKEFQPKPQEGFKEDVDAVKRGIQK